MVLVVARSTQNLCRKYLQSLLSLCPFNLLILYSLLFYTLKLPRLTSKCKTQTSERQLSS